MPSLRILSLMQMWWYVYGLLDLLASLFCFGRLFFSGPPGPVVVLRAKFDIKGHFGLRWD